LLVPAEVVVIGIHAELHSSLKTCDLVGFTWATGMERNRGSEMQGYRVAGVESTRIKEKSTEN
jgi:hypothetical protein